MTHPTRSDKRRYVRAVGPFNGYYLGMGETPVLIFNLNVGGGFVSFPDEQPAATTFVLTIELPQESAVRVLSQTVYRDPSGIAVRFLDLDDDDSKRIGRAVERMREQQTTSTPLVKLADASVVYLFERNSEVLQIEIRYSKSAQAFQITGRRSDGTTTQESFTSEAAFGSRLDEIRAQLAKEAWQTTGPSLLTDGSSI